MDRLDEKSRLFLEVAEDYAIIINQVLKAVQIKDTAASGPVTLNTPSVRNAIASFVDLVERNPQSEVEFRFLTTSEIGQERAVEDRPAGIAALVYWKKAASGADVTPLRRLLQSERFPDSVRDFVEYRDDEALQCDLIGRIRWDCGKPDLDTIRYQLEQRVIVLGRDQFHLPASEAKRLVELLVFRVLKKCTATEITDRVLTRADLYSAIDAGSQSTVPRTVVELLSRLASRGMETTGENTALLNPPSAREPGWIVSGDALPAPRNLLDRNETQSRVVNALDEFGVSLLVGGGGTGKSTISRFTARAREKHFFLVDLRNTEPQETRNRLDWVFARLSGLPLSILILEDFNCLEDRQASLSLARVLEAARRHGHEMLITCYRSPSPLALMNFGLAQRCVVDCPYLSKEETWRLVYAYGGDPRIWGNVAYLAGGGGHPQLVHAFVLGRANRGWPAESREELLGDILSNKDVDATRDAARRSLASGLPDDTRQLLYRLSLVVGRFSRALALAIGSVAPCRSRVGECIDQLVGPWIEVLGDDFFRVSPLASSFGRENLSHAEQRRIHATIATQRLNRRTIDPSEIDVIFLHALLGKSVQSLAVVARCVLTADHGDLERYADYLPVFRLHRIDQPIFPEDFAVSAVLRIAQFRLKSACKERDKLPDIVNSVFEEVGRIEDENVRSVTEGMAISTVLATAGIANYLDNWVDLLQKIRSMLLEGEAFRVVMANGRDAFERIEADIPSELFCIGSSNIENVARLEYIIDEMARLTPSDRSILFARTEEDNSTLAGFVSSPWLSEQRRGDLNPDDAATRYGQMAEKTKGWGFSLLSMNCTASQAVMLDEYIGDKDAAVARVREAIEVHGRHPLLAHALAKVYWRSKEYETTLAILRDVAKEAGEDNPVDGAYALRIAAVSAAKCGDWAQAEQWFIDAQDSAGKVQLDDMVVMQVGLGADAAVAAYHVGNVRRALDGLAKAIEALSGVPQDATLRAAYCHRVVRHTTLWLKSQISRKENRLEGHAFYMEPGACSNPDPSDAIRELPLAHIDISWYLLAEIEVRLGIESSISLALHDKLLDGPIPMMDSILRTCMLQADVDKGDAIQFKEHFALYLEAVKYLATNFDQLKSDVRSDDKSLDFERGVIPALCFDGSIDAHVEQAARHAILGYAMCSVMSANPSGLSELEATLRREFKGKFPGESIFEYWNGNSVEISELEKTVVDLVKRLGHLKYIEPLNLWMAGVRFFELSNGTMLKRYLIGRIAAWQRAGWKRISTTENFRLVRPRWTVPLIEEVLSIPEDNDRFLAKLLLATSEAVDSSLGMNYRGHLTGIAEK